MWNSSATISTVHIMDIASRKYFNFSQTLKKYNVSMNSFAYHIESADDLFDNNIQMLNEDSKEFIQIHKSYDELIIKLFDITKIEFSISYDHELQVEQWIIMNPFILSEQAVLLAQKGVVFNDVYFYKKLIE